MSTLPPEMISDILCRLPVKSLLRFRCTTKDLCSTIDAPDFAKLHLRRSRQSLILTGGPLCSIDLHSLEPPVEIQHPIKTAQRNTKLIGSCNGLLCLFNSDTDIVLWNMSTTKHRLVPFTPIVFPNEAASFYTHQVAYGFGYDSVHGDYKLVRIVRFRYTVDSEVMVYTLKSNSWKKVEGFPYDYVPWVCWPMELCTGWPTFRDRIAALLPRLTLQPRSSGGFRWLLLLWTDNLNCNCGSGSGPAQFI